MRKIIAAGNWKMNGSREMTRTLLGQLTAGLESGTQAEVLVFPAFGYLQQAVELAADTVVQVGAQNLSEAEKGAYTGEMSGAMLIDLGCTHVLVGHSERRAMYQESSTVVARKFAMAQSVGLVPVLCVGETLEEREAGRTNAVVAEQLQAVLDHSGVESLATAVLAYEPVWAIGTGKTATPDQAQEVHAFLRNTLSTLNAKIASSLRILYGGSVNGANASALFAQLDVDGGLVGGASLDSSQFLEICTAA